MLCGLRCCSVRRKLLTGSGKAAACPSGQLARDIVQHGQQGIMKGGRMQMHRWGMGTCQRPRCGGIEWGNRLHVRTLSKGSRGDEALSHWAQHQKAGRSLHHTMIPGLMYMHLLKSV